MTGFHRGEVAVCVLGTGTGFAESLRAPTPSGVPILEVESETDAASQADPADIVLIRPGCRVAGGWLDGLRAAAYASSTTATATPLTQHDLDRPLESFEEAAARIRSGSLRLRPRIETPTGPCVYVRRSAIELVGGAGEEFWARLVERGLAHVFADDVLVLDPRPSDPAASGQEPPRPRARAISAARRALRGLSAVIDARILYGPTTGTHIHVLELIGALARTGRAHLTAILPDKPSEHALSRLEPLPNLSLLTYRDAGGGADIVHRPFQLTNSGDLTFLRALGARFVLTQQDLIAFHNPAYFPTAEAWREHRQLTARAMAAADRVLFFSAHTQDDAVAEDLVEPNRAGVVPLGVDHPAAHSAAPVAPAGAERLVADKQPMMLCLGTDFLHKNRLFALRILRRLTADHAWDGALVLAGPAMPYGASREQEAHFRAAHPELDEAVLDLGPVTEAGKAWLFARAALVVYPSVLEGFGLVPFEAAAHRVPCLWAPGSSLSELLPDEAAGITPWDEEQSARRALALVQDVAAREDNLQAVDAAASGLTWDATATRMLDVYHATADAPARAASGLGVALSEDAARLVGPGGELPADVHRPLLALATHRRIADPVFGALKLGYRASQRARRPQRRK